MKIYKNKNVWDAALDRMRFLFDEFPHVIVCSSGGKDSTVILNLALKIAEEKNRLPLEVLFVDQEFEYQNTIDYMKKVMADPRVKPLWLQIPLKMSNVLSENESIFNCWDEEAEWIRDKEGISIKKNPYGAKKFREVFHKFLKYQYPKEAACYLSGVRADESPNRYAGISSDPTYFEITWAVSLNKQDSHYAFYPIYDWKFTDVWKAIHDNEWDYCKIYDWLYRYGTAPRNMRVSNIVPNKATIHNVFFLHEIEPKTWEKVTKRLKGVNQTKHISKKEMLAVSELPFMFRDWFEYRDYLTDKLIVNPEHKAKFFRKWKTLDELFGDMYQPEFVVKKQISAVLSNDYQFGKIKALEANPYLITYRKWKEGKLNERKFNKKMLKFVKKEYLTDDLKQYGS